MGGSGVISGWKARRELARLGQQLRAIPEALWEPFAQRAHDTALARGFPLAEGRIALRPKVALVLCWQPHGLAPSFLATLEHLVGNGYAPFVVSNAPLSPADHAALAPLCWRRLERPNFGYDFGGYRDGLRLLRDWGIQPDRLVILNDSVWFPLWPDDQTLQRAEAADLDVAGMILRQRDTASFLESYFFSIRGPVLDHPGFRAFWDGLRLTSNKYKVIRRGERGFGVALKAAGLSMGPLFPQAEFDATIRRADEPALRRILAYAAVVDPGQAAIGATLATAFPSPDWPTQARAFIAQVLLKAQFYSAFPVAAARHPGYPVLKKSMEPVSAAWRAAFLKAVDDGVVASPNSLILLEARARH
jgi:hypothetical protein